MAQDAKLSFKQRMRAVGGVAKISFKTAPGAVFLQLFTATFNAVLPIVTTYFAALTTTALAQAVTGDRSAGERVFEYLIITTALGIFSTAWSTVQSYIDQALRYKIDAAVSDSMYEHFLRLEFWRYDDITTIDTYDKAKRFSMMFPYLFQRFADLFGQVIGLATGIIALMLVSPWLGLLIVVALIPSFFVQLRVSRAQAAHWKTNVDTRRTVGMIEYRLLQPKNIAELRLYGIARFLLDLRMRMRDKDDKARIEFERKFITRRLGADAITATAEVIALVWIIVQIISLKQPIGQFLYVQQIVSRALSSAGSFIVTINSIDEDLSNLFEYQHFIDMPEANGGDKRMRSFEDMIRIENVSFNYPKTKTKVLKDVSIDIKRGQHIAIVGENGAGKSTLIKLITGLYEPSEGAILVDGTPLQSITVDSWHKHLAVLQQDFIEYNFATARNNVFYGDTSKAYDQSRFDTAIDMAESRDFLEKLPKGVDNYVSAWMEDDEGNSGTDLSGGQWQRVALARNFYRNSPIIILDEPTSAVDALAEARIFKHIFDQNDKTIITISHRLSTVKKADIIYMLKHGKVVETGTYKELVEAKGEFYKMFESQM